MCRFGGVISTEKRDSNAKETASRQALGSCLVPTAPAGRRGTSRLTWANELAPRKRPDLAPTKPRSDGREDRFHHVHVIGNA
jgi:hypothetical protein